MPFYEKGNIRIHYEEAGSGFPLLVIPGGGLNSTVAGLKTHPFDPLYEFANEFRVIAADLRNPDRRGLTALVRTRSNRPSRRIAKNMLLEVRSRSQPASSSCRLETAPICSSVADAKWVMTANGASADAAACETSPLPRTR
jgi:pimeloyl-ACP methyl ester carboxylesterase